MAVVSPAEVDPAPAHSISHASSPTADGVLAVLRLLGRILPRFGSISSRLDQSVVPGIASLESALMNRIPVLGWLHNRLRIPPLVAVGLLLSAILGPFKDTIQRNSAIGANIAGVAYPSLATFWSIQRAGDGGRPESTRWLCYWPIFGVLTILDEWIGRDKKRSLIYNIHRSLIFYWLSSGGALMLYERFVEPMMRRGANVSSPQSLPKSVPVVISEPADAADDDYIPLTGASTPLFNVQPKNMLGSINAGRASASFSTSFTDDGGESDSASAGEPILH
ncbi:uncharacterized protein BJ171DRAFT_603811 [Polychytrium aggregatum]|uniref:uncharacterized protein n=1 Tax=Polychytrium aggregatum TaxID=110093 RepID=UPI0022FE7B97|nr:uncharacterized protein BJ171DRAFT_603811 [Polychytrium aggregatum]KAI9193351.1 hypothetical protein BJ171DRAFT_603811 [Polychytrium aggregatum]